MDQLTWLPYYHYGTITKGLSMSITWTNGGLQQWIAQDLLQQSATSITLHLFTNNVTPAVTDTLSTYTECALAGYVAFTPTPGTWSITATGGVATATYPNQTFTFNSYAGGTTIYGYYWSVDFGGTNYLLGAELFASSYAVPSAGGSLLVAPTWSDKKF